MKSEIEPIRCKNIVEKFSHHQTDRQTDKQTDRRTDRQTDTHCDIYVGGKVRVSEFIIFLDLQHCGSK